MPSGPDYTIVPGNSGKVHPVMAITGTASLIRISQPHNGAPIRTVQFQCAVAFWYSDDNANWYPVPPSPAVFDLVCNVHDQDIYIKTVTGSDNLYAMTVK